MSLKVSFKVTILCLFTALTLILGSVIIYVNYQKNRETVLLAVDNLLDEVARSTFARIQILFEPHFATAETLVLLPSIETEPGLAPHPVAEFLYGAFRRHPEILSAYVGFETGDFFQLFALAALDEKARAGLQAPPAADYATRTIRRTDAGRVQSWRFLDAGRNTVGERADVAAEYDPRERAWYVAAAASEKAIVTDFYAFFSTPSVGVTVAKRFKGARAGVFAIDLTLSSISGYLDTERNAALKLSTSGQIALVARDGGLAAHSNKRAFDDFLARQDKPAMPSAAAIGDPVIEATAQRYRTSGELKMQIREQGSDWIARAAPLPPPFPPGTIVAIAIPSAHVVDPLIAATRDAVLMSILIVLVFLPLVYLAANAISAPLVRLTGEIDRIRRFQLAAAPPTATFITEIHDLAGALTRSKFMLRVFEKYVPRNLVEQFVDTGSEPALGGERRVLTVFFSDVRDFTTISEELPPEELMLFTSEYLEGLVTIILEERGTVDKFVGDQIMAYWNAPTPNPNHVTDGCIALLRCRAWSNARNAEWAREGRRVLYTRFALHSGEAVIGNVGSSDRMDYTVVGNTINLGSRLEGLNKVYGTQVIVSEPVAREIAGRFVLRPLDRVLPKGGVHPLQIYELLGTHPDWADAPAGLAAERAALHRCARWSEVYDCYLKRDWHRLLDELDRFTTEFGEDTVTALYYDRVARFLVDPPPADWDGVIRYSEK